jgi:hypothetical protein
VLWNVAVDDPAGNVRDDFQCPSCSQKWTKYDLDYVRAVPVYVAIDFARVSGTDGRYYRCISQRELEKVAQIEKEEIRDWHPNQEIYPYRELMSMGVTKHGVGTDFGFLHPPEPEDLGAALGGGIQEPTHCLVAIPHHIDFWSH